ncbi:MAG: hypothetical protein B7Z80_15755 [Rhodospirillales bacterium 20-64-7]|nr:MAG: hypothetical protein B7Z80_15755 [Rhodospirillales bacterium 20-64-7]HQT78418.1 hypothetical protein [Rhodopila sp.]
MGAGYLVVRAVVADPADRTPFDEWYRQEHLPDALKAFDARSAMRGWSTLDPAVHTAFYRFHTVEAAQAAASGPAIKDLIAAFDRCWGTRVTRTRDILAIADELEEQRHERS